MLTHLYGSILSFKSLEWKHHFIQSILRQWGLISAHPSKYKQLNARTKLVFEVDTLDILRKGKLGRVLRAQRLDRQRLPYDSLVTAMRFQVYTAYTRGVLYGSKTRTTASAEKTRPKRKRLQVYMALRMKRTTIRDSDVKLAEKTRSKRM